MATEARIKEHERHLLMQARSTDDPQAVEEMFSQYGDLLRSFAHRYQSSSLTYEEAYQIAALGLLAAMERFDMERGTSFITFAYPTIMGELKRYYRDRAEVVRIPRRVRDLRRVILMVQEKFREDHRREPTIDEIAQNACVPQEDVVEALATAQSAHVLSLDYSLGSEGSDDTLLSLLGHHDSAFEHLESRMELESILGALPPRLRAVVELKLEGWTQKSIAENLDVSQMQVSRLQRRALKILDESRELREEPA
jgi:RNA polymerase sigma-B factor